MKRYLVIIVALILVLALFGCGKDKTTTVENDTGTVENNDTVEDEAESAEAESAEASNSDDDSSGSDSGLISPEFKKTMDDYEAWFDHYCDVMERYQEDSTDLELLSEMTDLLTEETAMLEEMENMDQSEMNNAELAYYIEVTARIEKKLLEVAYQ
ncbi:MAG: hypothetical protein IJJ06_07490 [Mogibacterium sp.]|nr:hypothetical protein [Mogibacterium sp.]